MHSSFVLSNASLVLPDRVLRQGALLVRDGLIEEIWEGESAGDLAHARGEGSHALPPVLDCQGAYVLPRLVEMHIHGCFGKGFEQLRGGQELIWLARRLRERGVGTFVPTILWDKEAVGRLVKSIEESGLPRSTVPGIHIEGPFVNPAKRGGISLANIGPPDPGLLDEILAVTKGLLKIMTLAPELPGAEALYGRLEAEGVLVSLGHSDARGAVPLPSKAFSCTHLFNAMSGLDHRAGQEGLANLGLSGRSAWVELNADGIHVNKSAMRVARSSVSPGSLILTSDAVVSAGLPFGEYRYFGFTAVSGASGVRYKESGTLIGSSKLGMEIVKSYMEATGAPLYEAVAAMSTNPSRALGLDQGRGGGIVPGAAAELFVWDKELRACTSINPPEEFR